jgi:ATP-dependent helicase HrpB
MIPHLALSGGMELPIDAVLPELCAVLRDGPNAVLVAAPGAGKTTRAPLALLGEPWAAGGKLILLSPRRITARAGAAQLARQLGEQPGGVVGYRVRLDSKVGPTTRLEVVTEGVFTRMIQADPALEGVAGVIFDEFHERHLEADLGLALALDAQAGLRPDLRLVIMSATLDAAAAATLLGAAPIVESAGRLFPVDIRYLGRPPQGGLEDAVAAAVLKALAEEPGDILCFLPGAREIEWVKQRLESRGLPGHVDLRPLMGQLDARAQDAAIAASIAGRRKIVLATAIAESSLTIDGVRVVVDAGLARKPRFEPATGLTRLETVRASQAAVTQRAGRAGRTQAGVGYRLWDAPETRALPAFDAPEILESDLTGLALDLAAWGAPPDALRWMTPPPAGAWASALADLKAIAALDGDARLTDHGRRIAALPLPPRLAHMLAASADQGFGQAAAEAAVLLTEQGLGGRSPDLGERSARWRREGGPRAQAAAGMARRLSRAVGADHGEDPHPEDLARALAIAYPDRIARRRGGIGDYVMANGRAALVEADAPLASAEWIVVAEVSGEAVRPRATAAAALPDAAIAALVAARATLEWRFAFEPEAGAMRARKLLRLGAITVRETPEPPPRGQALQQAWIDAVRTHGPQILPGWDSVVGLVHRFAFAKATMPERDWPPCDIGHWQAGLAVWAGESLADAPSAGDIPAGALARAAWQTLSHAQRQSLDQNAPVHFVTPLGSELEIDYAAEGGPAVAVRLQELFGQRAHPMLAGGRAALVLRLLSPANRPVQTTKDLPGFWAGSYAAVRSEMKGRYPKHPWPDDPAAAEPTRRAKPRPPS